MYPKFCHPDLVKLIKFVIPGENVRIQCYRWIYETHGKKSQKCKEKGVCYNIVSKSMERTETVCSEVKWSITLPHTLESRLFLLILTVIDAWIKCRMHHKLPEMIQFFQELERKNRTPLTKGCLAWMGDHMRTTSHYSISLICTM